jgi:hypothetical protein
MANCREFNFIAKNNDQSKNKKYGGKGSNSYRGYTNKIFSVTNNDIEGGIDFINGANHNVRSVINSINAYNITISGTLSDLANHGDPGNEAVKFYPRVDDSNHPGQSSNNFALFNGSSILKGADIKYADIHLTHTLFQDTDNNHIVKKDDGTLLNAIDIETDGYATKMEENNVYTFIDENVAINGIAGNRCEIGPNIYLGKGSKVSEGVTINNLFLGEGCEIKTNWVYKSNNRENTEINQDKFSEITTQTNGKKFYHIVYENGKIKSKKIKGDFGDLHNKIYNYLWKKDFSKLNEYEKRNTLNKNIWIGKHINISNRNCFEKQKIHENSAEETALTNLIIYNKTDTVIDINDDKYEFYHNSIIELNYYKKVIKPLSKSLIRDEEVLKNTSEDKIFIFVENIDELKLAYDESTTDDEDEDTDSTSKKSSGKKGSSKKMSALDALIYEAFVTDRDKIGPEIRMSTGRMRVSRGSTSSRRESDTRTKAFTSGEISDEIKDIASDIQGLIKDFKGSEGIFSGGGSNYVSKMQAVDDSLNSIKFLESKIQESRVGKDKDVSSIGLFKFITSESRKALKDKQLTDSTRKLYEELEADKKDLEPYYSSKFILKSGDVEKLLKYIDSLNDTNKWGGDKFIQETKQKIINGNKDQINDFITKLKAEYTKTEGIHGKNSNHFKNICQLVIDITGKSKYDNPYLFKELAKLRKDGDMFDSKICVSQRKDTDKKKQGQGQGDKGQGKGDKGQGKGDKGQGKGDKGQGKAKGKKKKK